MASLSKNVFKYLEHDFLLEVGSMLPTSPGRKPACVGKFDTFLQNKWDDAKEKGCFRYGLDNMETKVLPGKYGFVAQLNVRRAVERRKPQTIRSLVQPFEPNTFNFNKVKSEEILFELRRKSSGGKSGATGGGSEPESDNKHLVIINVSPLEYCNSLLVPSIRSCLPQCLTKEGLNLAVELILLSSSSTLRIGFNSLCAYASVNHYHYHLFYLNTSLYLETVATKKLAVDCYEVVDYAVPGFVFQLENIDVDRLSTAVMKVVSVLVENDIPHNLFITKGAKFEDQKPGIYSSVRVFLWPRRPCDDDKDKTAFNVACCEISGHLPIKDEMAFRTITEPEVVNALKESCEDSYWRIKPKVLQSLQD